jgi:hypothetical protein
MSNKGNEQLTMRYKVDVIMLIQKNMILSDIIIQGYIQNKS